MNLFPGQKKRFWNNNRAPFTVISISNILNIIYDSPLINFLIYRMRNGVLSIASWNHGGVEYILHRITKSPR